MSEKEQKIKEREHKPEEFAQSGQSPDRTKIKENEEINESSKKIDNETKNQEAVADILPEDNRVKTDEEIKADAIAKAKAAAAARAKAAKTAVKSEGDGSDADDVKAKAIAAAKAKAAAAGKVPRSAKKADAEEEKPLEPSHNQPLLDKYLKVIEEQLGKEKLEDSYINRISKHVPTIIAKAENYFEIAEFLKNNEQLKFDYISELHGTDFVTHMELYVYLYSYTHHHPIVLKVKMDRNQPVIPSLVPLWEGANWPECEAYDLLGIHFENHPELKRILLGEEWIGYPLRKDYEPHDVEV